MTAVLRQASPADSVRLADLGATVWIDTYVNGEIHPAIAGYIWTGFAPQRIASQIAEATRHWIVAELNDQLVGYAHVKQGEPCPNSAPSHIGEIFFELGSQKYKNDVLVQDLAWLQTNS